MKKMNVVLLSGLFISMALASCGGEGSSGNSTAGASSSFNVEVDPNIKATISMLIPSGNENETMMIDKVTEGFNLKFPNVTIEKNYVSVSSYEATVRNQSMAGSLPDIVWTNSPEFYFLIKNNIAEPLNPYISASEGAGDFDFKTDFKTAYFDMGSAKGSYYVVPRSADSVVTFYNKKLLSDAGIDMTKIKNGWTWSDFTSICAQYRTYLDNNGHSSDYYPVDANLLGWNSVSYPMLRSFGSDVLDESGKVIIDSAETRTALAFMQDMISKRYTVKTGDTSGSSFEIGTAPFIFQSASFSLYDDKRVLHNNVDIVNFPLITGTGTPSTPKIGAGIAGYTINKKASNKALCWQYLNYLLSKDGQNALAEGGLNLAPIRNDLNDYKTAKWGEGYTTANLDAYLVYDEYKIAEEYLGRVDPKYMADLQLAFQDMISDATMLRKTIEKTIDDAVSNFEDALSA
ncbi:MAG: extracellular solute-binding protein [Bacilli bacterium]